MRLRQGNSVRVGLYIIAFFWMCIVVPLSVAAAPYAAFVMDARTGEVLHASNADTRLHPASLTKMMTLYITFEAVERGEISLDTKVRISRNAASEPPSKLGLKAGQQIAVRYLIRAAAVKSANDAATALAEAIGGSEAAFARRMNRTAKALGMSRTTFKNAHGLTTPGHLSTARDMSILGRHVLYDYPEYYNIFSRRSTNAGVRDVANTNRRLLDAYAGADGIKTGYTRAAGFNLVASAERGNERIIATVFGGRSTATRNQRVAELLDMGFKRAPTRVALRKPDRPRYTGSGKPAQQKQEDTQQDKVIRTVAAVRKSLRPRTRPATVQPPVLVADLADDINAVLKEIQAAETDVEPAAPESAEAETSLIAATEVAEPAQDQNVTQVSLEVTPALAPVPPMRPAGFAEKVTPKPAIAQPASRVITRASAGGTGSWGISVGRYGSRFKAERALLTTALAEMATLDGAKRRVIESSRGYDATFLGLDQARADLACRRLQARNVQCFMISPG